MLRTTLTLLILVLNVRSVPGEESATDFFESKIRPVLVKHCFECHAGANAEGGLRVDQRKSIRSGGDRGPAIVPMHPEASVLLSAIAHDDDSLKMPPKGPRLGDDVIANFRKWIENGAVDPRSDSQPKQADSWPGMEAAKTHWAYQPLRTSKRQVENDVSGSLVDHYILRRLTEKKLRPSEDAEPRTLIRRLHFDLVGLPPSRESIQSFLTRWQESGASLALEGEVDQLLESPQFGERWGRHWLDVARFGESSGGESNVSFPYAWRYRDYVIDAVNDDIPYDQFLTEQVAGDLLPAANDSERARQLIATGFLAVGTKNLGENNDKKFQADLVDEQIDSLTRAVLGSSVACARCHHHKLDPFTMQDYYALAGVFASTRTFFGTYPSPANNRGGEPLKLPRVPGQKILHQSLRTDKFEELTEKFRILRQERDDIQASQRARFAGKKPKKQFTLREVLANTWRIGAVEGKLATLDDQGKALPLTMGVTEATEIVDVPLLARGEIGREGETVARRFPQAISFDPTLKIPKQQSGRLELARWLTDRRNPLTSRVFVNRVWKHLFGQGLVGTTDNFGTTGDSPSHPELLDKIAGQFMQEGWSLKRLVRSLVLSQTYRQASNFNADYFQQDPENRLLWRMPKRRLEAESIRDAMLFVSGELDPKRPAGSHVATIIGDRPISLIGLNKKLPEDLDGATYRSVYLPVIRDRLPDVLELFDFAEPSLVTGNREITNVPVQALYLMNSVFVHERATALASRLMSETDNDRDLIEQDLIEQGFEICFGRKPNSEESDRATEFLELSRDDGTREQTVTSLCQALLSTAEFRNID